MATYFALSMATEAWSPYFEYKDNKIGNFSVIIILQGIVTGMVCLTNIGYYW
eukprot:gene25413-11184_t